MRSLPQPCDYSNILYKCTWAVILGLCPGSGSGLESHIKMGHHKAWELLPSASRTRYGLCYGRRDDIENDNKKGTIRPSSHIESSVVLLCSRVIIMQRCLKTTGQTTSLALIVAVTEGEPTVTPVWSPHPPFSQLAVGGSVWVVGVPPEQAAACHMRCQGSALRLVRTLVIQHEGCFHWLKETGERTGSSSYLDWDKGCWEAGHTAAVEAGMCAALGMERSECHHSLRLRVLPLAPMGIHQFAHWIPLPRSHHHLGFLCSRYG